MNFQLAGWIRRWWWIGVIVIIGGAAYAFWNFDAARFTTAPAAPQKVIIGYVPWPGYVGLFVARDLGYFRDEGLDVELKKYDGLSVLSADYVAGKVDGRANLTLEAVNEAYQGLEHRVIAVIDYSNGADGIIAIPSIRTMGDVRGKRVAVEFGSLEEFFLRYALERFGLAWSDIRPINANPEEAAALFSRGEADAAVTYEPFMSAALAKTGGLKIYSSADAPGLITDILTLRKDFIDQHPAAAQKTVNAYMRGIQYYAEHPNEARSILARELGVTPAEAAEQLSGIKILDARDNGIAYSFAAGLESLYGAMRRVNAFLRENQWDSAPPLDTDALIDDRFIRKFF